MTMPHPASFPDKPQPQTFRVKWTIEGSESVVARSATEAELKVVQINKEDIAASGKLTCKATPAEDGQ